MTRHGNVDWSRPEELAGSAVFGGACLTSRPTPAAASAFASGGASLRRMRAASRPPDHPTTPCSLDACKLAKPRTVEASPLQRKSNSRERRQRSFRATLRS